MRLITLGGLRLEAQSFREPLPLLLLAFLTMRGPRTRSEIQELFWPHQPETSRRIKSLSEALRRLKMIDPNLVSASGDLLRTHVRTDVAALRLELAQGACEAALTRYAGPFLFGIERYKRLRLGEELSEWIAGERRTVQAQVVTGLLTLAEERLAAGNRSGAAECVSRALALPEEVDVLEPETCLRLYGMATSLSLDAEATKIRQAAAELYGVRLSSSGLRTDTGTFVIGREAELGHLACLFEAGARLITVTGMGGCGKTTLAQAFLRTAGGLGSSCFVPLAHLQVEAQETELWQAVASGVGASAPTFSAVARSFGTAEFMLVLDDFERLRHHAPALERLLEVCPQLRLLVTSRQQLGLGGEHVFMLRGLSLPNGRASLQQLRESAAGRLLLAASTQRGAWLQANDAPALAELCHLTGGLPLALKLVAGWLPSLTPRDVIQRLREPSVLLCVRGDGLERPSLEQTFAATMDLLDEKTRQLFFDLSLFRDGFTLGAAEHILGATPLQLRHLISVSLLGFEAGRYTLHPLLRQFATSQSRGPACGTADAFAGYYLGQLIEITSAEQTRRDSVVKHLCAEWENLRVSWQHAVAHQWNTHLTEATPALQRLCDLLVWPYRGLELIDIALRSAPPPELEGRLLASKAWLSLRSDQYQTAVAAATQAMAKTRAASVHETSLNAMGAAYDSMGEFERAHTSFAEASRWVEPDSGEAATIQVNLAINALKRGDYLTAERRLLQAERGFRRQAKATKTIWCAYTHGRLYLATDHVRKARAKFDWALRGAGQLGLTHWRLRSQLGLAQLDIVEGHWRRAESACHNVRSEARELRADMLESATLVVSGDLAFAKHEFPEALAAYGASLLMGNSPGEPALLHRFLRLARAWSAVDNEICSTLLFAFCQNRLERMSAEDRRLLSLSTYEARCSETSSLEEWTDLTSEEVALQVVAALNDEGYIRSSYQLG